MKTERRHELQHNVLADWVETKVNSVKPYSRAITGALIGIVVLIGAILFVSNRASARKAAGWDEYMHAFVAGPAKTTTELAKVADAYSGAPVGVGTRLAQANMELQDGTAKLFTDRAAGNTLLRAAADHFQAVLSETSDSMLREWATFGLARAQESLGKLDLARENYKAQLRDWPSGAFAAQAKLRLDDLERPDSKEWYAWFADQNPKPDTSGPIGLRPDDLNIPSADDPASGLPSPSGEFHPKFESPKTGTTTPEAPATDAPKSDSDKPAAPADDAGKTDASKTDIPKTDSDKPDASKTDPAKTDAPKDEPKPDAPKTDAGKSDDVKPAPAKTDKKPAVTKPAVPKGAK